MEKKIPYHLQNVEIEVEFPLRRRKFIKIMPGEKTFDEIGNLNENSKFRVQTFRVIMDKILEVVDSRFINNCNSSLLISLSLHSPGQKYFENLKKRIKNNVPEANVDVHEEALGHAHEENVVNPIVPHQDRHRNLNIFDDFLNNSDDEQNHEAAVEDNDNLRPYAPVPQIEDIIPRNQNSCLICMDNELTHACVPCGHRILCNDCFNNSNLLRCPICLQDIIMIIRIW